MTAIRTFDTAALARAIEARDADAQLAAYDANAELRLVDRNNPPSRPLVLRGAAAIGEHLRDVCSRDLTHQVRATVADDHRVAFEVACRYSDGTQVLCHCVADVADGRITRQVTVQAWDD
jgi:hypothetical protein